MCFVRAVLHVLAHAWLKILHIAYITAWFSLPSLYHRFGLNIFLFLWQVLLLRICFIGKQPSWVLLTVLMLVECSWLQSISPLIILLNPPRYCCGHVKVVLARVLVTWVKLIQSDFIPTGVFSHQSFPSEYQ